MALTDLKNARLLSRSLEKSKYFKVLSDAHRLVEGGVEGDDIEVGLKAILVG